ncbi:MAG: glycosyltransferase family 2 protein, partial [Candidatus Moranbacteria bacterium CG_4_10_14_3_um_filter_41_65]
MMVSIIIPVYNAEETLSLCIDSILGNTYSDYEVILINDGSVDASW